MKYLRTLVACLLLCGLVSAQALNVSISPNPAPLGANITITATSGLPNIYTPSGCLVSGIYAGSPSGPLVKSFFCISIMSSIPHCMTALPPRQYVWNQSINGGFATPGLYYASIHTYDMFNSVSLPVQYYPITITGPSPAPVLTMTGAPFPTAVLPITINAPANPGDFYVLAIAGSTNTGFVVNGAFLSLDYDAFLLASLDGTHPSTFQNFSGLLDGAGLTTAPTLTIPNFPGLSCLPLHLQGVVIPSGTSTILPTNTVTFALL